MEHLEGDISGDAVVVRQQGSLRLRGIRGARLLYETLLSEAPINRFHSVDGACGVVCLLVRDAFCG